MLTPKRKDALLEALPGLSGVSNFLVDSVFAKSHEDEYIRRRVKLFREPLPKSVADLLKTTQHMELMILAFEVRNKNVENLEDVLAYVGMLKILGHSARKLVTAHTAKQTFGGLLEMLLQSIEVDEYPPMRTFAALAYREVRKEAYKRFGSQLFKVAEFVRIHQAIKFFENCAKFHNLEPSQIETIPAIRLCNRIVCLELSREELASFGLRVFDEIFEGLEKDGTNPSESLDAFSGILEKPRLPWIFPENRSIQKMMLDSLVEFISEYKSKLADKRNATLPVTESKAKPKQSLTRKELSTASDYNEKEKEQSALEINVNEIIRNTLKSFRGAPELANDKVVEKFEIIMGEPESLMKLAKNTLGDKSVGADTLRAKDGLLALIGRSASKLVNQYQIEQINKLLSNGIFPLLKSDQNLYLRSRAVWLFVEFRKHLRERNDRQLSATELVKATKLLVKLKQHSDIALISEQKLNWVIIFINQALHTTPKTELRTFGTKLIDLLLELIEGSGEFSEKALEVFGELVNCNSTSWTLIDDPSGSLVIEAIEFLTDYRASYFNRA